MSRPVVVRLVPLVVASFLVACASPQARRCRDQALDPAGRAAACAAAFAKGDVDAGAQAAEARRELGDHEAVVAWLDRLRGTEAEDRAILAAASSHWHQGDRDAATGLYLEVIDRDATDVAAPRAEALARAHYGLFYLAWERSDLGAALDHAHASARFAARAEDPTLSSNAAQAEAMLSYDLGDLDGVERAVDAAEALLADERPSDRARLLTFRALVHLDRDRPRLARLTLREALDATTGDEEPRLFRSIHIDLARAALDLGELEAAAGHLRDAEAHAEPDAGPAAALRVYRARLAWARGEVDEVAREAEAALAEGAPDDWAWELEMLRGRAAEAAGDRDAARDAFTAAAAIVERLRGDLGSEELQAWTLARKRRPFEALFRLHAEAGDVTAALDIAARARARRFLDAWIEATADATAADDVERAAGRWRAFEHLSTTLSVGADGTTSRRVALDGIAVLSYFEAEGDLWLSRLGAGVEPAMRRLDDRPGDSLAELRDRWLADPSDAALAEILSERLLPADLAPSPGTLIVVVPDGRWGLVPFAALRRDGRFWIEDHPLAWAPSLREADASSGIPVDPPVVLGDPAGDLPAARREALDVAATLGVAPVVGPGADLAALLAADRPRVAHLATHTGVGPAGPWLQLADGRIDLERLLAASWRPRLLVLATCAGAGRRELGPWGSLAGGLLAGGADQVLASLWSLDDRAAERAMTTFYAEGGADGSLGASTEALARAQRRAISEGRPVAEWAPFVLLVRPEGLAEPR